MSFGLEVRRLRIEAGFTQEKLAETLGLTQGSITQIETGRMTTVSVDTLFKLADALKVPTDHFRPFLATETAQSAESAQTERPMGKRK